MIDFTSSNLTYNFVRSDDIDIDSFINETSLNYIFENYLFYKFSENVGGGYVKNFYGVKEDKIDELFSDGNLGVKLKIQISYLMILAMLNCDDFYILTSVNNVSFVDLVFNQSRSETALGHISRYDIAVTTMLDKVFIPNHNYFNTVEFDEISKHVYSYKKSEVRCSLKTISPSYYFIYYRDKLTDEIFNNIIANDTVYSYTKNGNPNSYKKFSNFSISFKIEGDESFITLYGKKENYNLLIKIKTILNKITENVSPAIWSWKTDSFIYKSDFIINETYNLYNYDWENKLNFKYRYYGIDQVDLNDISYSYFKFQPLALNSLLKTHILNEYNDSTEFIFSESEYNVFKNDVESNIKYINNDFNRQHEWWDFKSSAINGTIGSVEDSDYIDIQGFDSTGNPILLYISKNIDIGGFLVRTYKVVAGGVVPINNSELLKQYSTDFTSLFNEQTTDYTGDYFRYDLMNQYVRGISYDFESDFLFSDVQLNELTQNNFSKADLPHTSYFVLFKNSLSNIMIDFDDKHFPYQILIDLWEATDSTQAYEVFDNYFLRNDVTSTEYLYESLLNLDYHTIIDKSYFYLLDANYNNIIDNVNREFITNILYDIKSTAFSNLLSDSTIYSCDFVVGEDLYDTDSTNYIIGQDWYLDLVSDLTSAIEVDVTDSEYVSKSEVLSVLMDEDVYNVVFENTADKFAHIVCKTSNILKTANKSIIINKVMGLDWFQFYNLNSSEFDQSFCDYLINITIENGFMLMLYDFDNDIVSNIAANSLEINVTNTTPTVLNRNIIENFKVVLFDKDEKQKLYDKYYKYIHLYSIDETDVLWSPVPFDGENLRVFNGYSNDIFIVKQ